MTTPPSPPDAGQSAFEAALHWGSLASAQLVRARKRVLVGVLIGTAIGGVVSLLLSNQYTSSATFIAQGSTPLSLPAVLQGAAATLGLERGNDYSPKFYADLLTSRPILSSALLHLYDVSGGAQPETYLQIEGFTHASKSEAFESALKHLAARVSASADVRTNIITLTVRARDARLSREIANQLLVALDSLNVGFRQNQSRESRLFYETRVVQSRHELDSVDAAVRNFLENNRVTSSPKLQFELQRLQRDADLKRGVYTIVVQQYEQARLQEARNVPTLTILSEPFVPARKSFPPRRLIVILGAALGLLMVWAQLGMGDAIRRFREGAPENWEVLQKQIRGLRHLG
jgi:uncharacterized protein involved in exopolysaccharide biosynthesis